MYVQKKGFKGNNIKKKKIVVVWKYGGVKGFGSTEDAERFINMVCKKTAPDLKYSVSFL
jgi:hypothetical protein